ncbi:MAG: hypothetical protein EOM30_01045 [Clostridia bacterium]|nr:hypothetical protein [Clostridia bacterium]NLS85356.1 hypothetical protein [Oscillospiraceae bacterium]
MQNMTTELTAVMQKPLRPVGEIKISCDIIDVSAAREAVLSSNDSLYYSDAQHIVTENAAPKAITATLEPMHFKADGTRLVAPTASESVKANEGYISNNICGANGSFQTPPYVAVSFTAVHTVETLTLVFDAVSGVYPSKLRITAKNGAATVLEREYYPASASFITGDKLTDFDCIKIEFITMSLPYTRARLQQLMLGYATQFDGDMLGEVTCKWKLDPIMRRLPETALTFEVENSGDAYDPDNPDSLWKYLEQPCPVTAHYGMPCGADGAAQWVSLGRYYLTGQPQVSDIFVTLKAGSVLDLLTDICTIDTETTASRSLYMAAQNILDGAGISTLYSGGTQRVLWDGLKNITTTAPMPKKPYRECLQYIAHAAGCALYTDRDGALCIMPVSTQPNSLYMDFDTLLQKPTVTKTAALSRVVCKVYTYASATQASTHTVTAAVQNAEPGAAEETIDNPLITSDAVALAAAQRVRDYLLFRNVYACEYRGLPAMEAGDIISLQSRVADSVTVRIAEHSLSFGNGISGKFTAKETEASS